MIRLPKLTPRQILIVLHDVVATAAAIVLTFYMRFEGELFTDRLIGLKFLPLFLLYAAAVYLVFGLHRNKWRFTSIPDLYDIFRAVTVLAVSLLVLDYVLVAPNVYGQFFFGKITILLYWLLQMFFLGASRVVYRYLRYARALQRAKIADATSTLVLGRAADAEVLLRSIESGAVNKIWPVGVLSPSLADRGQSIRGVPVLGDIDDLERVVADLSGRGTRVTRVILTPSALSPEARPEALLIRARKLGLTMSQLPSLDAGGQAMQLAPIAVEDLLLRPSVKIDYRRLETFVSGKAIIVTGGGGSIGSEICERLIAFGAARLLVIENSEPALHAVQEMLKGMQSKTEISGRIADIRDRARIMSLVAQFKPDMVFHAAALKHVPLLETDWDEGIKTNVFGSINVADAAAAAGAAAMVMISTDKAIEPVSVLGATKRFAEMYCEALDNELAPSCRRQNGDPHDLGAVWQCAGLQRLGGAEIQGADRGRRAGDRHASGHGPLFHDDPRSLRPGDHRGDARARAVQRRGVGLFAQHGPAGEDRRSRRAHHPAERFGAGPRHCDHLHRHSSGRTAARDFVRARRRDERDRNSRHCRHQAGAAVAGGDPRLGGDAGAGPYAQRARGHLQRAARRGSGIPRRGGLKAKAMDLAAFFKAEFAEHHDAARRTEAALSAAFAGLVGACVASIRGGGKLMFFGNGGSAGDAQHLATELTIRYKADRAAIAALALTTDTSALTAAGNDLGFDNIFARQIEALGRPGDVAIAISTSGKSPNIIAALRQAKAMKLVDRGVRRQRRRRHGRVLPITSWWCRPTPPHASRRCTSPWVRCCAAPWRSSWDWPSPDTGSNNDG